MVKKSSENKAVKNYKKTGVVAALVVAVAGLGIWAIGATRGEKTVPVAEVIESVSSFISCYKSYKYNNYFRCIITQIKLFLHDNGTYERTNNRRTE